MVLKRAHLLDSLPQDRHFTFLSPSNILRFLKSLLYLCLFLLELRKCHCMPTLIQESRKHTASNFKRISSSSFSSLPSFETTTTVSLGPDALR